MRRRCPNRGVLPQHLPQRHSENDEKSGHDSARPCRDPNRAPSDSYRYANPLRHAYIKPNDVIMRKTVKDSLLTANIT
jgi:hypothetical protein